MIYDPAAVVTAVEFARNIYASTPLKKHIPDDVFEVHYKTDDARLYRFGNQAYCVFRGTEFSIKEWIFNAWILKRRIDGLGRVHAGFFSNLQGLWEHLNRAPWFNYKNITFVGHSRGGALAQLAAAIHADIYKSNPSVITFGSPRVGNREWRDLYEARNIKTARVVNSGDVVPRIPVLNFYHTNKKEVIRAGKGKHSINSYYWNVLDL